MQLYFRRAAKDLYLNGKANTWKQVLERKRVFMSSSDSLKSVKFAEDFCVWCFLLNSYGNVCPSPRGAIQNLNRMAGAVGSLPTSHPCWFSQQ